MHKAKGETGHAAGRNKVEIRRDTALDDLRHRALAAQQLRETRIPAPLQQAVLRGPPQVRVDQQHPLSSRRHLARQPIQGGRLPLARSRGKNHQRVGVSPGQREVQIGVENPNRLEGGGICVFAAGPGRVRHDPEHREAQARLDLRDGTETGVEILQSDGDAHREDRAEEKREGKIQPPAGLARCARRLRRVQDLDRFLGHLEINFPLPKGKLEGRQEPLLVVELLRSLLERPHPVTGGEYLVDLRLGKLPAELRHTGLGFLVGNLEGVLVALQLRIELLTDLEPGVDGCDQIGVGFSKTRLELGYLLVRDEIGLEQVLDILIRDKLGVDQVDAFRGDDGAEALPAGLSADCVDAEGDERVLHLAQRLDLHVGVPRVEVHARDIEVLAQLLHGVALA